MKKKQLLLIFCLLVLPLFAYAADEASNDSSYTKDKKVEIGILNLNFYLTNDFLSLGDIFQETIILDLDKFSNGLNMYFGFGFIPLYFNINMGSWGFGLITNVEAMGSFNLSGKLLSFNKAVNDISHVSGALFASVGINGFFNIQKFKVTVRPSVFYTLAYVKPDIIYTFNPDSGNILKLNYDILVYTAFPTENMGSVMNDLSVLGTPGIDLALGVEYALSKNFDVRLEIINIPVIPSVLKYYTQYTGTIGSGEPMDPLSDGLDSLLSSFDSMENEPIYGTGEQETARPFRLSAWLDWRVFGTQFLTLTPMIGFSVNKLYIDDFSMEFGANARLNLVKILFITAGINYMDRFWRNSIDFTVDLNFFEFNIGADMRSPEFIQSWTAGGVGLNLGFKFSM